MVADHLAGGEQNAQSLHPVKPNATAAWYELLRSLLLIVSAGQRFIDDLAGPFDKTCRQPRPLTCRHDAMTTNSELLGRKTTRFADGKKLGIA